MTGADLYRAIIEEPEADTPCLVYADWLEERGDPRGEFIRAQVELARLSEDDPRRKPLQKRGRELEKSFGAKWRASLPAVPGMVWGPFVRGFPETLVLKSPKAFHENAHDAVAEMAAKHPEAIRPFSAALILSELNSTCHAAALSFLPLREWPALIEVALEALGRAPQNQAAESVVEEATMQCPDALHPHLDVIFEQGIMAGSYCGPWPCAARENGTSPTCGA